MPDRFTAQLARSLIYAALLLPFATQAQTDSWYRVELMVFSYPAGGDAEQWAATPELAYPQATRFLHRPDDPSVTARQARPDAGPVTASNGSASVVGTPVTTPVQLTAFTTLPSIQQEFASKADSMQRSGRYRILFHEAWLQPMTSQSDALSIVLDHSGDGGQWPALQGTIKLYKSNDLYLETNLWLNTQGEYLHSSWHMPPPPLGPAFQAPSVLPGPSAGMGAAGPEYPYRHAVLLQQTRRMRSGEVHYLDHPMLGVVAKITVLGGAEPETRAAPETTVAPKPGPTLNPST